MSDYSSRTYTIDEIPADIKQKIDIDTDKFDSCTVFDSLEDFAIYEVDDGWYSNLDLDRDYNGDFENYHASAMALCWFIWEKGFTGDPIVRWFN